MCICVNCKLVDVCKAYHFVEEVCAFERVCARARVRALVGCLLLLVLRCLTQSRRRICPNVEQKHQQPHLTETPVFEPRDGNPTIEVRSPPARTPILLPFLYPNLHDRSVARCRRPLRTPVPHLTTVSGSDAQAVIRKEAADTPQHLADRGITVEYDVVACEDFGCQRVRA